MISKTIFNKKNKTNNDFMIFKQIYKKKVFNFIKLNN
jgi:hypothetical protein